VGLGAKKLGKGPRKEHAIRKEGVARKGDGGGVLQTQGNQKDDQAMKAGLNSMRKCCGVQRE